MKIRTLVPALAAAAALTLAGCSNAGGGSTPTTGSGGSAAGEANAAAVALLPDAIKKSGELRIGTDAEYPPNEFKDDKGQPEGWGVNLANAVAARLGLTPKWEIMDFGGILPRIQGDTLDMGSSSFTDTAERQKVVDFVNYLDAGSQWAAPKGQKVDPEDACGLTIAVQADTVQYSDELPARSDKCKAAGKKAIDILAFPGQAEATQAVLDGRAAAFTADSPVTGDAVKKTGGKLELVGKLFDAAPYGFATSKGGQLTKAVQAALQSLMDDGTYLKILTDAGVESGALKTATINAGK